MYYNDLVAAGEDMRSLFTLVETAIMLSEKEYYCLRLPAEKAISKYEEEEGKEVDGSQNTFLYLFPRKLRSSLVNKSVSRRYPQQNHENLNKITTDTEKQDIGNTDAQSPSSCLTENASCKRRRAVLQKKKSLGIPKKAKFAPLPQTEREKPEWLVNALDVRLIFEKTLSESDVNPNQCRLLMPFENLKRNDFLKPEESSFLEQEDEKKPGMGAVLWNQMSEKWSLILKIWELQKKGSVKGTLNYALNCGWNEVVKANGLKPEDKIYLWSFRLEGLLCFALDTE